MTPPVLTIAGSDPSGGAGIQADLKTFTALRCYGMAAITALTVQNTLGVRGVHAVSSTAVEEQVVAVLQDIQPKAIKTGMLYDADNTRAVVRALKTQESPAALVVDPVSVSTSGHNLLSPSAIDVIVKDLFPMAKLVTPNKAEAESLLSLDGRPPFIIENLETMITAGRELLKLGPEAALVKGGHITTTMEQIQSALLDEPEIRVFKDCGVLGENMNILVANNEQPEPRRLVVDVLCEQNGSTTLLVRPYLESTSTHGTGCTLSSAIAAELAHGSELNEAVRKATLYTHSGIEEAPELGGGFGPLQHLHAVSPRLIPKPTASSPYPFTQYLINNSTKIWKEYVEHPFVRQLGEGTLPREKFIHFLIQDYHYLKYYARAYGLLAGKSHEYGLLGIAAGVVDNVVRETKIHIEMLSGYGITVEDIENTPETLATRAYGGYLIDAAVQGDGTRLQMSLLACLLGYGEVGIWLVKQDWVDTSSSSKNTYLRWIKEYEGQEYRTAVKRGLDLIEQSAVQDPPSENRLKNLLEVWRTVTWLEKSFWDSAMMA